MRSDILRLNLPAYGEGGWDLSFNAGLQALEKAAAGCKTLCMGGGEQGVSASEAIYGGYVFTGGQSGPTNLNFPSILNHIIVVKNQSVSPVIISTVQTDEEVTVNPGDMNLILFCGTEIFSLGSSEGSADIDLTDEDLRNLGESLLVDGSGTLKRLIGKNGIKLVSDNESGYLTLEFDPSKFGVDTVDKLKSILGLKSSSDSKVSIGCNDQPGTLEEKLSFKAPLTAKVVNGKLCVSFSVNAFVPSCRATHTLGTDCDGNFVKTKNYQGLEKTTLSAGKILLSRIVTDVPKGKVFYSFNTTFTSPPRVWIEGGDCTVNPHAVSCDKTGVYIQTCKELPTLTIFAIGQETGCCK